MHTCWISLEVAGAETFLRRVALPSIPPEGSKITFYIADVKVTSCILEIHHREQEERGVFLAYLDVELLDESVEKIGGREMLHSKLLIDEEWYLEENGVIVDEE